MKTFGKKHIAGLAALALVTMTAACASGGSPESSTAGNGAGVSGLVYLMLPNTTTARFTQYDAPAFIAAMEELAPDVEVKVVNANDNQQTQVSQAETALLEGARALVTIAADASTAGGLVAKAKAADVPVIDYVAGIESPDVAYHVQNDLGQVGELQAQTFAKAVENMPGTVRVERLYGNKADNTTTRMKVGQDKVLQPLIDSGKVEIVCEDYVDAWQASVAQQLAEQCLTRQQNGVDAVLAFNDGTALGAIAALQAQGLRGEVPVFGGQDTTLDALQYILRGWLQNSIAKNYEDLAVAAAKLTVSLLAGTSPPEGVITDEFAGRPNVSVPTFDVTAENMQRVVDEGLFTKDELCAGDVVDVTGFCG